MTSRTGGDAFLSAPRFQTGDGTALRPIRGEWLAADAWPLDPIQAALLDTGELLTFSSAIASGPGTLPPTDPHDTTVGDVYDPSTGTHTAADHPSEEVYGAALGRLSTGELIALGGYAGRVTGNAPVGANQLSRFDSTSRTWIPSEAPGQARHAAAGLTLGDGSFMALGGGDAGSITTVPSRFDGTTWSELPGADLGSWLDVGIGFVDGLFPYVHLAPAGDVVVAGWDLNLGVFDTEGAGVLDLPGPARVHGAHLGISRQPRLGQDPRARWRGPLLEHPGRRELGGGDRCHRTGPRRLQRRGHDVPAG